MITALISLVSGLFSGVLPEVVKEIKDTRAHGREMEFLQLNQKLVLERAAHETAVKIEETRTNREIAEIQENERNFESLMRQAMTPVGIGWIDGLNAAVRPLTAIAFMLLFVVGVSAFIFGFGTQDASFATAMSGLFSEAIQATLGFMFGSRAIRTVMPKAA